VNRYFVKSSIAVVLCALALPLSACVQRSGGDDEPEPDAVGTVVEASAQDQGSSELQHEISQALWGCFAVGSELVGQGQVQAAKDILQRCFSDDMTSEAVPPPAYAGLAFTTSGGPSGWVDVNNAIYRRFQLTRVVHVISNIVIKRTGPNTALVDSSALAVHVFPDEHVLNTTVKFKDEFRRIHGAWKITHRVMTLTSLSQAMAWQP
jgi:hypothetical protein